MTLNVAPLNSSFMLSSILGILISTVWVYKQSPSFGAAFTLVFGIMFVSSIISMTYGDPELELKMDAPKPRKVKKKK